MYNHPQPSWVVVRRLIKGWTNDPADKKTPRHSRGIITDDSLSMREAQNLTIKYNKDEQLAQYNHWAMHISEY